MMRKYIESQLQQHHVMQSSLQKCWICLNNKGCQRNHKERCYWHHKMFKGFAANHTWGTSVMGELQAHSSFKFLCTRRLNQDPLENFLVGLASRVVIQMTLLQSSSAVHFSSYFMIMSSLKSQVTVHSTLTLCSWFRICGTITTACRITRTI